MASEKRINTVDSFGSNELDEYGVWVKSDPQILSSLDRNEKVVSEPEEADLLGDLFKDTADESFQFLDDFMDSLVIDPVISEEKEEQVKAKTGNNAVFNVTDTSPANTDVLSHVNEDDVIENPDFEVISMETIEPKEEAIPAAVSKKTVPEEETVNRNDPGKDDDNTHPNEACTDTSKVSEEPQRDSASEQAPIEETQAEDTAALSFDSNDDTEDLSMHSLGSDKVVELLTKIVDELLLIQDEISDLKGILLQRQTVEQKSDEVEKQSVFPEITHETIALTGDELDNIFDDLMRGTDQKNKTQVEDSAEELSAEDLQFLKGAVSFSEEDVENLHDDNLLELADLLILEESEEVQRLREEDTKLLEQVVFDGEFPMDSLNNKTVFDFEASSLETSDPVKEENSAETESDDDSLSDAALDDLLIDDLLIETGSIKDIPIELDLDEDEELGDETALDSSILPGLPDDFDLDLNMLDDADVQDSDGDAHDSQHDDEEEVTDHKKKN